MKNIVNHKKIAQELVKNFYSKRQFNAWNVVDYDDLSRLVIFNGYSIFRVFKEDFLIEKNEHGFKPDGLKKCFDADLSEYKKAERIEIKKKYDQNNKKFYTKAECTKAECTKAEQLCPTPENFFTFTFANYPPCTCALYTV